MCETDTIDTKEETPKITRQIGNTEYVVGIHFNQEASETMSDKVKRMIKKDVDKI